MESFNGRMRDKLLNESLFFGLRHARQKVTAWVLAYSTYRPHSSIGYLTPEKFVSSQTATGRPAAQVDRCAARPVAHSTLRSVFNPRTLVDEKTRQFVCNRSLGRVSKRSLDALGMQARSKVRLHGRDNQ